MNWCESPTIEIEFYFLHWGQKGAKNLNNMKKEFYIGITASWIIICRFYDCKLIICSYFTQKNSSNSQCQVLMSEIKVHSTQFQTIFQILKILIILWLWKTVLLLALTMHAFLICNKHESHVFALPTYLLTYLLSLSKFKQKIFYLFYANERTRTFLFSVEIHTWLAISFFENLLFPLFIFLF